MNWTENHLNPNHRLLGFKMLIPLWKKRNMSPEKKGMNLSLCPFFLVDLNMKQTTIFWGFQPFIFQGLDISFHPPFFWWISLLWGVFTLVVLPQAKVAKHVADRSGIPSLYNWPRVTSPSTTWMSPKDIRKISEPLWGCGWFTEWMVQWFLDLPPISKPLFRPLVLREPSSIEGKLQPSETLGFFFGWTSKKCQQDPCMPYLRTSVWILFGKHTSPMDPLTLHM